MEMQLPRVDTAPAYRDSREEPGFRQAPTMIKIGACNAKGSLASCRWTVVAVPVSSTVASVSDWDTMLGNE